MKDPSNFHRRLWDDQEVITQRYEKSTCALIAVKQALEKQLPLSASGRLFLDQYAACRDADPLLFTRVWTDPTAYYWVRLAYQLLANNLSGAHLDRLAEKYHEEIGVVSSHAALEFHLGQFGRFVLSLHYHAGSEYGFIEPLQVRLPFVIPATGLSIGTSGVAEVLGIAKGILSLRSDGRTVRVRLEPGTRQGIPVRQCPVARHHDFELRLLPQAFNNLPGLDFLDPVLGASLEFQEKHAGLVEQTLKIIHQYAPEM